MGIDKMTTRELAILKQKEQELGMPLDLDSILNSLKQLDDVNKKNVKEQKNKIKTLTDDKTKLLDSVQKLTSSLERIRQEKAQLKEELEATTNNFHKFTDCQICVERRVSRVLTCGHLFCKDCTDTFLKDKCPFCQQKANGYINLYLN